MEALKSYLVETRTSPVVFARIIGVDGDQLGRILAGEECVDPNLAKRIIDAAGGAIDLHDLIGGDGCPPVADIRSRIAAEESGLDVDRLAGVFAVVLPSLIGGRRRAGDRYLPMLAAEAAVNTYIALSTVTTRTGRDRFSQALRPVFEEILEEMSADASVRRQLPEAIAAASELYFQERSHKRRD